MNSYRIGVVATGLLGLWLVVHVVVSSTSLLGIAIMEPMLSKDSAGTVAWFRILFPVFLILMSLLLGFLMIIYRRQITRSWLLPDSETDVPRIKDGVIAKLAFALFGLSLIARGVHYFLYAAGRLMSQYKHTGLMASESLVALAYVVAGYSLFRFATPLAERFSDEPRASSIETEE